jgi:hypothetical protein
MVAKSKEKRRRVSAWRQRRHSCMNGESAPGGIGLAADRIWL